MAPLFIHFTGEKKYNVLKEPAEIHFRRRAKGNLTIYVVIHDRRVRVFLSGCGYFANFTCRLIARFPARGM